MKVLNYKIDTPILISILVRERKKNLQCLLIKLKEKKKKGNVLKSTNINFKVSKKYKINKN